MAPTCKLWTAKVAQTPTRTAAAGASKSPQKCSVTRGIFSAAADPQQAPFLFPPTRRAAAIVILLLLLSNLAPPPFFQFLSEKLQMIHHNNKVYLVHKILSVFSIR
jgi:hypothetical protein